MKGLLLAVFVVMLLSTVVSADTFYGKSTGEWVKIAQGYGFTSELAIAAVKDLPSNPTVRSNMALLVETNNDTRAKRLAVGDKGGFAYSRNGLISAFIETLVDNYPEFGVWPAYFVS